MPDKYKKHTACSAVSVCRVGNGKEKRPFSSISQVDEAGTHLHLDANCQEGTITAAAIFGARNASGSEQQVHVLTDFGVRAGESVEEGLEFHLQPGDLHYEDAAALRHGGTSPAGNDQARLALILYLAKGLDHPNHGYDELLNHVPSGKTEAGRKAESDNDRDDEAPGEGSDLVDGRGKFEDIPSDSVQCTACKGIVRRSQSGEHGRKCHGA